MEDLERVRHLFEDLDTKKDLIQLLGPRRARRRRTHLHRLGEQAFLPVRLVLIVSPFEDTEQQIVGVLGAPADAPNYARIIPMVDYTARPLLGRLAPSFRRSAMDIPA